MPCLWYMILTTLTHLESAITIQTFFIYISYRPGKVIQNEPSPRLKWGMWYLHQTLPILFNSNTRLYKSFIQCQVCKCTEHVRSMHVHANGYIVHISIKHVRTLGVGRLVCTPRVTPLVLPFYHTGMDDVLPNYTYIPQPGKKVIHFMNFFRSCNQDRLRFILSILMLLVYI